jgi:glycosyltransferase involved in cell wall biosynthesis
MTHKISVVIPAKNEAASIGQVVSAINNVLTVAEIIVVDDGSTDETAAIAIAHGAQVVQQPYSIGNGAAIKTGAQHANGDIIIFMDADGQHDPKDIPLLLKKLEEGYDMAVGARDRKSQASIGRGIANGFYNRLASYMANQPIMDLTSGFRAVYANKFHEFLYLLPNGFSYPTTITMAFFRAGYTVAYIPITAHKRQGKSHLQPLSDGIRFLLIIFKIATLYSPLKIFLPMSACFFVLGSSYALYTILYQSRFTNMSALLLITSILIFLIGLVSEQITQLIYKSSSSNK